MFVIVEAAPLALQALVRPLADDVLHHCAFLVVMWGFSWLRDNLLAVFSASGEHRKS